MYLIKRNVVSVLLLTLFTCGIYNLYWMYTTQESIRQTYRKELLPSGGIVILLSIVTCGIYYVFWMYRTVTVLNNICYDNNIRFSESDVVLFVILGFFIPTLFNVLTQHKINNMCFYDNEERYY